MRRILISIGLALALLSPAKAADSTVSAMTAASAFGGTELLYVVQGAADRKGTPAQMATYVYSLASGDCTISSVGAVVCTKTNGTAFSSLATTTPGTGVATALGVNIGSAGAPVLFNGAGGTPSSITLTNAGGTAASLTAGNVTTNANLTGVITSVGNATSIASQTGTGSKFVVDTTPTLVTPVLGAATATSVTASGLLQAGSTLGISTDTLLSRSAAASWQLGAADAASPVAQTLSPQNVVTGTSNTAGADFTIAGSKGTGTGAGGSLVLKVAPAGGTGTSQNALATALTIDSTKLATFGSGIVNPNSSYGLIGEVGLGYNNQGELVLSAIRGKLSWGSSNTNSPDLWMMRGGVATLQHGNVDDTTAVAQTTQVQSVVAGTSNTAGADWTFNGSKGTGTGIGGNIVLQTAPAGTTGTSQNALSQVAIVDSKSHIRVGNTTAPALTSCGGGSPTIVGTDVAGTVTMGTTATGCVITFKTAYANAPICTVTWRATPLLSQSYTTSTTAITLTQTSTSSDVVDYHCFAQNAG